MYLSLNIISIIKDGLPWSKPKWAANQHPDPNETKVLYNKDEEAGTVH